MANDSRVVCQLRITQASVTCAIDHLNHTYFRGGLTFDYSSYYGSQAKKSSLGTHVWTLRYASPVDGRVYCDHLCWLRGVKTIHLRPVFGGDFAGWVAVMLCNEVALRFRGLIWNDSLSGPLEAQGGLYPDIYEYLEAVHGLSTCNGAVRRFVLGLMPPEFLYGQSSTLSQT